MRSFVLKHKTKLLILLSVLLILDIILIIATALTSKEGVLYPRFVLDNPQALIMGCILLLATDALVILFVFMARGAGIRSLVAVVTFFSAISSFAFCNSVAGELPSSFFSL